jgi:hypothetical protein
MQTRLLLLTLVAVALACRAGAEVSITRPQVRSVITNVHKVQIDRLVSGADIVDEGGRLLADYGSYALYELAEVGPRLAARGQGEIRDEYNLILLNAGRLDSRRREIKALRKAAGRFEGRRLHLVQFVGPVQPRWRGELVKAGVQIVAYIPYHTYLVNGDSRSLAQVQQWAAEAPQIQWEAPYLDDYKLDPAARTVDAKGNLRRLGTDEFAIQLVRDAANTDTIELLERLKLGGVLRWHPALNYVNVVVRLAPENLNLVIARPDVVSIQPYFPPTKFDERQDQIIAGRFSGNVPSGPGYLEWLAGKGFTQEQFTCSGFAVDVSDSGIDNGTALPEHFGLYVGGGMSDASRVIYNRLEGTPNDNSTLAGCDGHGNLNAHVIGGVDSLSGFPFADSDGFHYGLGVCPFVRLGSSVIFDPDSWTDPDLGDLQADAYQDGARISSNSWGGGRSGAYDMRAQMYDALVRDAQRPGSTYNTLGNQEMVIVFAAGNAGPREQSVGSAGTAKNVICVGAGENVQPIGGTDGSFITDEQADNANDIASFSARGPCSDGRHKPDLVAPGTHVTGGVPQSPAPGPDGTAAACFTGAGVSGGANGELFFPSNQQFYTASSGTSHSTPCVAGACALLRQYFINHFTNPPSPAMTKAYLMNSACYMTGVGAKDTLWSDSQGMGRLDLGTAFDGIARILRDQLAPDLFTASGQSRTFIGAIADTNQPFRVTVAWTDAPGSTTGAASVNDLDLIVTVGGNIYKGNVFSGAWSATGGAPDSKNNTESVYLPAGTSGNFAVQVLATGINDVGIPNASNALQQDFALVIYNGTSGVASVIAAAGSTLLAESCFPTNNAIDPGEAVSVGLALRNAGSADTTNLVATLLASSNVTSPGAPQVYGALSAGGPAISRPFTFTASGNCGGTITATLQLQDGAASIGTVTFALQLGRFNTMTSFTENFDGVAVPDLPAGWTTTASGAQVPWVTSAEFSDTPTNAAFAPDVAQAGLTTLVTPAIPILSSAAKLTFRNKYVLEAEALFSSVGYDGGVLEIQIGSGEFTDILKAGGSFGTGGYNHTLSSSQGFPPGPSANALAGRHAWSGNSSGFITTVVNLPPAAAGQNVRLRWLCGTDGAGSLIFPSGWFIDSISILDGYYTCSPSLVPPTILDPHATSGSFIFSFQTVLGQTYTVEYNAGFTNSAWTALRSLTGDGSLQTIANALNSPSRYYRVRSP